MVCSRSACSKSLRVATALAVLIFAALASPAQASDDPCTATNGIQVQDARLLIVPNADGTSAQLTLSGHALISDPDKLSGMPAGALCRAAIGERFLVNNNEVCSGLYYLSGGDVVKPDGKAVEFALSQRLDQLGTEILIAQRTGEGICAYGLVVEVRPGLHRRFLAVNSIPKSLNDERAEFDVAPGVRAKDLDIRVLVAETPSSERALNPPTSW